MRILITNDGIVKPLSRATVSSSNGSFLHVSLEMLCLCFCSPFCSDCQPAIEQPFQSSTDAAKNSASNTVVDFQERVKKAGSSFRVCGLSRPSQFQQLCSSDGESHAQNSTANTATTRPLTLTYHIYFAVRYYPFDPTLISNEQTR